MRIRWKLERLQAQRVLRHRNRTPSELVLSIFVEQFEYITIAWMLRRPPYRTDRLNFVYRQRTCSSHSSESSGPFWEKVDSLDKFHFKCRCVRRHNVCSKHLPVLLFCLTRWSCICWTLHFGYCLSDGVAPNSKSNFCDLAWIFASISCWTIK